MKNLSYFSVCMFVVAFFYMEEKYLSPSAVFISTCFLAITGYVISIYLSGEETEERTRKVSTFVLLELYTYIFKQFFIYIIIKCQYLKWSNLENRNEK